MIKAWGYLHTNGQIISKRYLGPASDLSIEDAKTSPFVVKISDIAEGDTLDEAFGKVMADLEIYQEQHDKV